MMEKKFNEEKIDAYLLGELQGEALSAFQQEMTTDPDLSRQVQDHQKLMKALQHRGNESLRRKLKSIQQEVQQEEQSEAKVRRLPIRTWMGAAAGIALLIVAAYFLFGPGSATDPQALYASYYQAYPVSFATRDSDSNSPLLKLDELYNNKTYNQALIQIESLQAAGNKDPMLQLGAGICALETGETAQAILYFNTLLKDKDSILGDQANWYLALSYLKENNIEKARTYLQDLAARTDADHHRDALRLLDEL